MLSRDCYFELTRNSSRTPSIPLFPTTSFKCSIHHHLRPSCEVASHTECSPANLRKSSLGLTSLMNQSRGGRRCRLPASRIKPVKVISAGYELLGQKIPVSRPSSSPRRPAQRGEPFLPPPAPAWDSGLPPGASRGRSPPPPG